MTGRRTFAGYRPAPPAEYAEKGITNSGETPDYEGCIYSDGTVAIRWLTEYQSHSAWSCWADFYHVHGHPEYGTRIIFDDGAIADQAWTDPRNPPPALARPDLVAGRPGHIEAHRQIASRLGLEWPPAGLSPISPDPVGDTGCPADRPPPRRWAYPIGGAAVQVPDAPQ